MLLPINKRPGRASTLLFVTLALIRVAAFPVLAIQPQETTIQVLDSNYAAVGSARVVVVTPGEPEISAVTDKSGNARFRINRIGGHTLIVNVDGNEVYRDQFAVRESVGRKSTSVRVIISSGSSPVQAATISANELNAPSKSRKLYQSALDSIRRHDYPKAIQILKQALAIYPEYARAHNAKGVVFGLMDNVLESESAFRDAIRYDSKFAEPHINLGRLLLEAKKPSEARDQLEKAVALKQDHVPAIELLIDAMLRIHDEESAVSLVRSLHFRGADHPALFHLKIASELERHTMIPLAAEQYSLVLDDDPSDSERGIAVEALSRIANQS